MKKFSLILFLFAFICLSCFYFYSPQKEDSRKVIKFASWGSKSEIEILKPLLKQFEQENPEYKIEFIHIPENYFQKIHLLFASNQAPDIVFMNNLYLPFFANAGVLEEVSEDLTDDFEPKALEAMSYKGKLYGVPRDLSTLVIYVNKDLFKKYNINIPQTTMTMDDFLQIAQNLTLDSDNDGKTDIWGVGFEEKPPLYYLPFLMSEGGGIISDDLSTKIIDTPQSQKGLKFYSDLRNKYHVAPTKAESASVTMAQLFLKQKLAMQISGRWLVPKYKHDADFNWDVINLPSGFEGSIAPVDASGWCITTQAQNKQGAKALVAFLSSPECIMELSESGLIIPACATVLNNKFAKTLEPNNAVFVQAVKTGKVTPVSPDYNKVQDEITAKTDYLFNN